MGRNKKPLSPVNRSGDEVMIRKDRISPPIRRHESPQEDFMIILRTFCIVSALGLGACASQSAYTPAEDSEAYGYYSMPLGDNRYRVGYNGNSTMSENLVKDYALFRAAELTMQQGKDWFRIVERESSSVEKAGGAGIAWHDTDYVVARNCGLLSCSSSMRPVMHTMLGVDSASGRTIWSSRLEIVTGTGAMPTDGSYYDADTLLRSLMAAM
jgi:hypothetical protein